MLLITFRNVVFNYLLNPKLSTLLLALCLLNSINLHSQTTQIPDSSFEQALVSLNIDTNGLNGNILNSDAFPITTLFIGNTGITNLSGIDAFKSLIRLYAYDNQITTVDLSYNPHLEVLDLENNNLNSIQIQANNKLKTLHLSNNSLNILDVSSNSDLEYLSCNINNISTLNLASNTKLIDLRCYDNNLSVLNINNNPDLEMLFISENNLNSLQVSMNTSLKTLTCDNNTLNLIDVSNNPALTYLSCSNNNLSSLDISSNQSLKRILCNNNNLTSLDLTNTDDLFLLYAQNNYIQSLDLSNNPGLKYFRAENNALNTIDVRNATNHIINEFVVTQNASLTCVFVDNTAASYLNDWEVDSSSNFVADENECQTLATAENVDVTFNMYPNPASSHVNINLNVPTARLKVYAINGQFLYEKPLIHGKNVLDTSNLSSGLYVVAIHTEETSITKKLVIK